MSLSDQVCAWIERWDGSDQHRTGTAGDWQTSEWLLEEISSLGAGAELSSFPFIRKNVQTAQLTIGHKHYAGVPMFDGGSTSSRGCLGCLSTIPKEDSILVLTDASSDSLNQVRRVQDVKGIVMVSDSRTPGLALLNADSFEKPFGPPVLQVSSEFREDLIDCACSNESAMLSVVFDDQRTTACNVETKIAGTKPDLAPLVVMTPKSSWYTSTAERIGGIVCWLECIRHFVEHQPSRDVIFTANTGHELGHVGLDRFLKSKPCLTKDAFLWVHFGANFGASESKIRIQSSLHSHLRTLRLRFEKHGITIASEVEPGIRPGGEARNIFDGRGEYVSILGSNRLFHHPDDRFATNVDLPRLLRIKSALIDCVQSWASSV